MCGTVLSWHTWNMQTLGVLALLVAAAVAESIDVAPAASEKITYKCSLETHNVIVKDVKTPIYLCAGEQGAKFLLASAAASEPSLDAVLDKDANLKVLEVFGNKRQKRQFGGGFGGAGSHASSTAFGGGGGGGFGSPFGGGGFGGGFSGAQSSASAGALGGGGGFSPFG